MPIDKAKVFKQAAAFEEKIRRFLRTLEFSNVRGGPDFCLGNSSQIDACGGVGKTLIVIDAHSPVEQRRKSIRTKIKQLRGERISILRGMHRTRNFKKYSDVRLVVAVRRMQLNQADRNFASIHPRVYLWDEGLVNYYQKLAAKLSHHARNDLLGELDIPIEDAGFKAEVKIPAVKVSLRGQVAYLFFASDVPPIIGALPG